MSPPRRSISDAELDILKALWERGSGTVRDILAGLHADGRDWAYTTVQTLLARLEGKGFVAGDRSGRAHVFAPTVSREEFIAENLDDLASRVCEGATGPLVLNLVQGSTFTKAEIAAFRDLLDQLEPRGDDDTQNRDR